MMSAISLKVPPMVLPREAMVSRTGMTSPEAGSLCARLMFSAIVLMPSSRVEALEFPGWKL